MQLNITIKIEDIHSTDYRGYPNHTYSTDPIKPIGSIPTIRNNPKKHYRSPEKQNRYIKNPPVLYEVDLLA